MVLKKVLVQYHSLASPIHLLTSRARSLTSNFRTEMKCGWFVVLVGKQITEWRVGEMGEDLIRLPRLVLCCRLVSTMCDVPRTEEFFQRYGCTFGWKWIKIQIERAFTHLCCYGNQNKMAFKVETWSLRKMEVNMQMSLHSSLGFCLTSWHRCT